MEWSSFNFPDEVGLGTALAQVYHRSKPKKTKLELPKINKPKVREIINTNSKGFLSVDTVGALLKADGVPQVVDYQVNIL